MVLMLVVVNLSAMVAARGAASLAEPLSIMPGWAKRSKGRVWLAILIIIMINRLLIIMSIADHNHAIVLMRQMMVMTTRKMMMMVVVILATNRKNLLGRQRSIPVFSSVTPSRGGTCISASSSVHYRLKSP